MVPQYLEGRVDMSAPNINESSRELAQRRKRQLQIQRTIRRILKAAAWLGGSGLAMTLLVFAMSGTASVASAQTSQHVTPNIYDGHPRISRQPAGDNAYVALRIASMPGLVDVTETQSSATQTDPALLVEATCTLSVNSFTNTAIVTIAVDQLVIIDTLTHQVMPSQPASPGVHTGDFWQIDQVSGPQDAPLRSDAGLATTLSVVVTRFGRSAVPLESYQFSLTLTIRGNGEISCSIFAPA